MCLIEVMIESQNQSFLATNKIMELGEGMDDVEFLYMFLVAVSSGCSVYFSTSVRKGNRRYQVTLIKAFLFNQV